MSTSLRTNITSPSCSSASSQHQHLQFIMPRLFNNGAGHVYGDFRDDLERDGFAVIKGAIPRKRADAYAEDMFKWLEDL